MSGQGRRCSLCGGELRGAGSSAAPPCRCEPAASSAAGSAAGRPVPSPCIGLCELDLDRGTCLGCSRSIDEIRLWPGLSETERREILRRLGISVP